MRDAFDFDRECSDPYEFVQVDPSGALRPVPEEFRDRILVDTVHDGGAIPYEYRIKANGEPLIDPTLLERRYVEELSLIHI